MTRWPTPSPCTSACTPSQAEGARGPTPTPAGQQRIACIDQAGNVYAYEFLFVSKGVSLDGIDPEDADRIREAIRTAIKSFGAAYRRLTDPTVCM